MLLHTQLTVLLMAGDAYADNPYMSLFRTGLENQDVDLHIPTPPFLFPATRSYLRHSSCNVVQFDWVYPYYVTTITDNSILNTILTSIRSILFMLDLVFLFLLPVNIIRTVHNVNHHDDIFPKCERLINELLFVVSDASVVKCKTAAERVSETYVTPKQTDFAVIPDGNYDRAYENTVSKYEARTKLGITTDSFVFLYFGLIREYKGVPDLISAFQTIDAESATLWIVGNPTDNNLHQDISQACDQSTSINCKLEFIPDEWVQYYMNAADAIVLPYRDILNSGSAYLGLTYGKPVIAPAIGCIPAIFGSTNEFLYDPSDPQALESALQDALSHNNLEDIGNANLDRAKSFTWDRTAKNFRAVYNSTISG